MRSRGGATGQGWQRRQPGWLGNGSAEEKLYGKDFCRGQDSFLQNNMKFPWINFIHKSVLDENNHELKALETLSLFLNSCFLCVLEFR
jgi:hypothetical protein